MKPELVFKCFLGVVMFASVPQFYSIIGCLSPRQAVDPLYPRFVDLWWGVGAATALYAFRFLWILLIRPMAEMMIPERPNTSAPMRRLRVRQLSVNSFKLLYFVIVFTFAYFTISKEDWFPSPLGGESKESLVTTFWMDYPFQRVSLPVSGYYFVNFGYHLCIFACLLTEAPLPDFWENVLQVILAMLLMKFSYLANHIRLGVILMLLHDFCDVFVCATKTLVDTPYRFFTIGCCTCLMTSWAYLRLWSFMRIILVPIFQQLKQIYLNPQLAVESVKAAARRLIAQHGDAEEALAGVEQLEIMNLLAGWFGFIFFLLCLLLLNIYWFCLMLMSMKHFAVSGQTSDFHSRLGEAAVPRPASSTKRQPESKKRT